jgi:hypothetical protein
MLLEADIPWMKFVGRLSGVFFYPSGAFGSALSKHRFLYRHHFRKVLTSQGNQFVLF